MRVRPPVLLAASAALLLLACGESKEEKRIKELARICEGSIGSTIYDLEVAFARSSQIAVRVNGEAVEATCGTDVSTLECAEGPSHCVLGFWFPPSNDPDTCERTGCYFACQVRAVQEDLKAHEEDHLAPICGASWVDGQPFPGPFYGDPAWTPGWIP